MSSLLKSPLLSVNWPTGLFSGSGALNQVEPQLQQFSGPLFPFLAKKRKKKELSLQRPYPRPSACAGNLCVCVGVRDYTTCVPLIQRWRLCRPAGVSCSALRLSDRNGQMTVSAKNVLEKKKQKKKHPLLISAHCCCCCCTMDGHSTNSKSA